MKRDRSYFFAHPEQELREVEWIHYGRYLDQRMRGVPTQYITHRQEFYGREIRVTRDVLIPRPETEHLVDAVLPCDGIFIDVGTGSGAIAITLALEKKQRVFATDLSRAALRVAHGNAGRLLADVSFIETDLLNGIGDGVADVVVSNPPYVPHTHADSLQREVRDHEPRIALFGGETGLEIYTRLIPEAWRVLKPGGILAMELGMGQHESVTARASAWRNVRTIADLAGIPRVIVCERP
jgi:release factor glutamine methyltransferase